MSDSASKKLKQLRLPFAVLTSPGTSSSPKPVENTSPKTPAMSRKRKPSTESESVRQNKIGRNDIKENIATEAEKAIEIKDSDEDDGVEEIQEVNEVTPTASGDQVLHIKLPTSKRKINMDLKPSKDDEEEDPDDSVVYLDEKELKKSCKKSRKKKKRDSKGDSDKSKKILEMGEGAEDSEESPKADEATEKSTASSLDQKKTPKPRKSQGNKEKESPKSVEKSSAAEEAKAEPSTPTEKPTPMEIEDEPEKDFSTIPSNESSPEPEDPEVIHEEIAEVLSDNSDSAQNRTLPSDESSKTPSQPKLDITKLTPKQLARRQEQEARRLEKEQQRQKERDAKEQLRLKEKEAREDAKRKEKEEKEEAKRKEKEEREKKRLAELEKKEEEKRQKEEERKKILEQREEEKRAKEEERKRQAEQRDDEKRKREEAQSKKAQEEENRKKRAAEAFSKFFVPKKKESVVTNIDEESKDSAMSAESTNSVKLAFMPFQVKELMRLAPCTRSQLSKEQKAMLDEVKGSGLGVDQLYLKQLKNPEYKVKSMGSTWTAEADDDDVMIVADELEGVGEDIPTDEAKIKMKHRSKFLMFCENRRPAFHGTWRKKSKLITARKPLGLDQKFFDYEVESDDEWEEEEPGESLHGSDSEKEKDAPEEDYEVDNDFFVPHGHLSDEEMNAEDDDDNSPEAQKAKLKILQQEFAAEMKKKTEKIKPRLIGCIWMNGEEDENGCFGNDEKYHCSDIVWRILKAREAWTTDEGIKFEENFEPEIVEPEDEPKTPTKQSVQPKGKFNDGSLKDLVRLMHGNVNNKKFLLREFQAYRLRNFHKDPDFQEFSFKSVEEKINEISVYKTCPDEGPMFGKKCWYVKEEIIQEAYGEEKPSMPNEWVYILEKEKKTKPAGDGAKKEGSPVEGESRETIKPKTPVAASKPKTPVASKPKTPVASVKPKTPASKPSQPSPAGGVTKKRVQLLMSVPRGEAISESKKNNLISQYLKTTTVSGSGSGSSPAVKKDPGKVEDDDVMIIE